jgi:hypothetical protein
MNNTSLQGINRGLGTIASAHLVEHGAHVNPNRFLRNVKIFGDLAVAAPLRDAS